ncbi:MAG: MauE/DoxX family redox-associated membrane protein [Bacteroidota bacterium]
MIKKILTIILGILMILGGIGHLLAPEAYAPMIPDFIPDQLANVLAFITEVATGLALIIPKYRKTGGLLFMGLMIAFLPLHVWDVFRENPAIGPFPAPIIRLVIQFLLIYVGWRIYRK